ncbi:hypothetical protein H072_809 [Dactylellina haptotyla CBS 200.50]|uniref:Ribonuclease n=1 Tax=Dactylellina haptotyla (strain CBS 200.50) TaxID=1284197 RepID=S8C0F3_DACHA|nr:hypothetical protein H072_809 [Dactylellina haptotyla CBS 200.50]
MSAHTRRRGRPRQSNPTHDSESTPGTKSLDGDMPVPVSEANPEFVPPSISLSDLLLGKSYTFHSALPSAIRDDPSAAVTLGVDEAGRGPVLGPMVYGVAYCLSSYEKSLSSKGFDDSKKLTTAMRTDLMSKICQSDPELHSHVGWSVRVMSARDISAGMLRPIGVGAYNLNAQAHDTTIRLIREVIANGVNVKEIFVDTVGPPTTYQAKLSRSFPFCKVTVSKKADSLYPSVSAASIAAKVSRDFALEKYFQIARIGTAENIGSGYPSDPKTGVWLRESMDELFGWGSEARFSWSTAADMLKRDGEIVDWTEIDDDGNLDISSFLFSPTLHDVTHWFGQSVATAEF